MVLRYREEVDQSLTWDLSGIFQTEDDFQRAIGEAKLLTGVIEEGYRGRLNTANSINQCLNKYQKVKKLFTLTMHYGFLKVSEDENNSENQANYTELSNIISALASRLSFIKSEILEAPEDVLDQAISSSQENKFYLMEIKREKPHTLQPEAEKVLAALSTTLNAPFSIYNRVRLGDIDFPNFNVEGKEYPLSFGVFEGKYEMETDTTVRRGAFEAFSSKLRDYQHSIAATYQAHIQKEKTLATLRGFDSVVDSLLFSQNVDRELLDRQIDLVMDELAPHMRKYAKLLQRVHNHIFNFFIYDYFLLFFLILYGIL